MKQKGPCNIILKFKRDLDKGNTHSTFIYYQNIKDEEKSMVVSPEVDINDNSIELMSENKFYTNNLIFDV
jgi:hypothetical protein